MTLIGEPHTPCVRENMPTGHYHAGPGLSHSDLKRLRRTPWHYQAMKLDRVVPDKAPTPQMYAGTLAHCATLEPDAWPLRYVVAPEDASDKRTKAGKAFLDGATKLGFEVITQQQADVATAQAQALRALPEVAELLAHGQPELSGYWRDPEHGMLCKCRPDWVTPVGFGAGAVLMDVKTTSDASAEMFARSIHNFSYHTQADWYCAGWALAAQTEVHGMVFAVVESEYPYAAATYMLDDESLRVAHELNRRAVRRFAECQANGVWPGYPSGIQVIGLPTWAMREQA